MAALAGAAAGSFLPSRYRVASKAAWLVGVFVGLVVSLTLGGSIAAGLATTPLSFITAPAIHSLLGLTGVPLALRLRKFAESSKIGELPPVEE